MQPDSKQNHMINIKNAVRKLCVRKLSDWKRGLLRSFFTHTVSLHLKRSKFNGSSYKNFKGTESTLNTLHKSRGRLVRTKSILMYSFTKIDIHIVFKQ